METELEARGHRSGALLPPLRTAAVAALPVTAAAVMVGGIFTGIGARFYAIVAGLLGVALAALLSRSSRPLLTNVGAAVGLFAIGLLVTVPTGIGNVVRVSALAEAASRSGNLIRPPVPLTPGWQAIIGWLLGTVGFLTGWVGIKLDRAALALVVPLPVAAVAGISVPHSQQVASGVVVLVLFVAGLAVLANSDSGGASHEDSARPPAAYQVRKAVRALPLVAAVSASMYALGQTSFLFPHPLIDPTQQPQKPKTVPLSKVPDRVLFSVHSTISGPWRIGSLDVFDGRDWRLPPFAQNRLRDVPRSGIVDPELAAGVTARFDIAGLGGTVLPTLPNTTGIVANGPKLAYDSRNGNIRVSQGVVRAGLSYSVTSPSVPDVADLEKLHAPIPKDLVPFARMPFDPPPAVAELLAQAPKDNQWDEFDFLRTWVLDHVTVSGTGVPKPVDKATVQDVLGGSKRGSPFEIVAVQAMLARWIGLPARIGYGFDGGDIVGDSLQVRPRNGATFVEVWFRGYKWLPVIGVPKMAQPSVADTNLQQFDPNVLPSNDISVKVFLPLDTEPGSVLLQEVRTTVLITGGVLLLIGLIYVLFPAFRKSSLRSRRRAAARAAGPRARIALAYAELRDLATDFGFVHPTDTPLMFLSRLPPDAEHAQLAWLVTRALWGDLQLGVDQATAADAEELSRALQRRMSGAQPVTMRLLAAVSRLSMRHPYAPGTDLSADLGHVPSEPETTDAVLV